MTRRRFLQACAAAPLSAAAVSRTAAVLAAAAPAARPQIVPPDASFMATLTELLEVSSVPGISIGVVQRGRVVWQAQAGVTDLKMKTPVSAQTIWKAASLSKQVTGYAALRLVDAGELELDRPLADYLAADAPSNPAARKITARHVLTHSSGLPNWRRTAELVPEFAPGTGFRYSGEGYFYLARCLERITGLGFESHMQARVFAPLGMASSTYLWRADLATDLATGYHRDNVAWDDAPWRDAVHRKLSSGGLPPEQWTLDRVAAAMAPTASPDQGIPLLPGSVYYPNPAMSLMTRVPDYLAVVARFTTVLGDRLDLSARSRAMAAAPMVPVNHAVSWGMGWGIEHAHGTSYLFQHGSLAGACMTFVLLHPQSETGIVAFTNHGNGQRVIERVFGAATGHEHPVFLWA
jgi:CubicO group peptidase (beta-lactamase class C family)